MVLGPPLSDSGCCEKRSKTSFFSGDEFCIADTDSSLVVDGLKDMEVREKSGVKPMQIFWAKRTSVLASGHPNAGKVCALCNGEIDGIHGVRNRVEGRRSRREGILPDLKSQVDESGDSCDRGNEFSETAEILNRHLSRPTDRR